MKRGAILLFLLLFLVGLFAWWRPRPAAVVPAVATVPTPIPTPAKKGKYHAAAVPKKLEKRISMDQGFALGFAKFLCGVSYTNCQATTQALNNMVTPDLKQMFATQFFSPAVVQDIYDRKLTMSFKMDADIIPIEVTDSLDKFFVEGVLTTLSDLKRPGEVVQRQPVAMIVGFSHGPKTQEPIDLFQKADPSEETILAARAK